MLLAGLLGASALISVIVCAASGAFLSLTWLWLLPVGFLGAFFSLVVLAFLFLLVICALVDLKKPQAADSPFYRCVTSLYCRAATTLLRMRVHTEGLENIPKDGRFLLVCNHLNDLDPVTLLAYLPKSQLAFITKWENTNMFLVGKLMHKIMCQPINRENDREALKTILTCIRLIKEDQVNIAVFPEGYTSKDGLLHHFRSGVFKIAQKTKVPIVVCTIQNTNKVFHNFLRFRGTDVHLHLLGVVQPQEFEGVTTVELGDRIHAMMAADLGPERVAER